MQQQLRRSIGGLDGKDTLVALGFVVAVNLIGATPAALFSSSTDWIEEPWFFPPDVAFPVVWTTIFTLCGIALFLLWRQGFEQRSVKVAVGAFAGQFVLNLAWTPAFFGLQRPDLGLVVITLLLVALSATIYAFDRVDRRAAVLLLPYLVWGLYATALNTAIYLSWA